MSANVVDVMARIAAIEREIINPSTSGSLVAYDNVPYTINTADMPLFVNYTGNLSDNTLEGDDEFGREYAETRNHRLTLYIAPFGTGVEGEKWGLLAPFFDLVYAKFMGYPHLKNLAGVRDAKLIADTGMTQTVKFISQEYFGAQFTLRVTTTARRLLAKGD